MTQLDQIQQFMQQVLGADETGHGTDHIERVLALSNTILEHEPSADPFIVRAAALLHDTYDDKLFSDVVAAKQHVADFLNSIDVTKAQQTAIFYIIDNMSWSKSLDGAAPLDINGQIVQDADRLEAIGAIAVARTIEYGVHAHHALYDPNIKPRYHMDKKEYRKGSSTVINHFYEKLFLLKDYLNTDTAKKIGAERHQFMLDFVHQFEDEWQLKK